MQIELVRFMMLSETLFALFICGNVIIVSMPVILLSNRVKVERVYIEITKKKKQLCLLISNRML